MSELVRLLDERERRRKSEYLDASKLLTDGLYNAWERNRLFPLEHFYRCMRRYHIAYEDAVWARRGFSGPHRPRVGESIAKPRL